MLSYKKRRRGRELTLAFNGDIAETSLVGRHVIHDKGGVCLGSPSASVVSQTATNGTYFWWLVLASRRV